MPKIFVQVLSFCFLLVTAHAKSIKDYQPYNYEVRFTNPICADYEYSEPVSTRSGKTLTKKPKNVYCKASDAAQNVGRAGTPSEKILNWIRDPKTQEIFMTYLSFSNAEVADALCEEMKSRNLQVRLVLDSKTGLTKANQLEECSPDNFTLHLRGHVRGLDFAHNKVFIVNPESSSDEFKFAFGSGNMTSGLVLHHENWHFITTNRFTYLAQSHLCLMRAELKYADSGYEFRKAMGTCLEAINNTPEDDIRPYFVPGQGEEALAEIKQALLWATDVSIAAHRFSYSDLIAELENKLNEGTGFRLRLVVDDDIYWVQTPNTGYEKGKVFSLMRLGASVRFMETNSKSHLLHHNKFILFRGPQGRKALFTGAGNFTGTAFSRNWENFYMLTIPEVVSAVESQYMHMYYDLATSLENLPAENIQP